MADKIIPIDSKYRNKHYSNGFFAAVTKKERGGGIVSIIFGFVLTLMGAGIFALIISYMVSINFNLTENDMTELIFGSIIGLIFFAPGIFCIWFGFRSRKTNENDSINKFMKVSDYPESVIRDFGKQVLEEGSLRMWLGSMSTQGFLTRDYICMHFCVIKIEDILGTYFVQTSGTINVNGKIRTTYDTDIAIFSNHKTLVSSSIKEKGYRQIVEILKQKNPSIDTANGRLLSEKEFKQIKDQLCK